MNRTTNLSQSCSVIFLAFGQGFVELIFKVARRGIAVGVPEIVLETYTPVAL